MSGKVSPIAEPRAKALAAMSTSLGPNALFDMTLDEAYPAGNPLHKPYHNLVLIQYQTAPTHTRGGLAIPEETRSVIQANQQVVKVIDMGPMAFCNRETGELWKEGAWCKVGDFVRVGKYTPDKWEVRIQGGGVAVYGLIEDLYLRAAVVGNPLDVAVYV
jgi:co-chaperonin GroES (HSP10)